MMQFFGFGTLMCIAVGAAFYGDTTQQSWLHDGSIAFAMLCFLCAAWSASEQ